VTYPEDLAAAATTGVDVGVALVNDGIVSIGEDGVKEGFDLKPMADAGANRVVAGVGLGVFTDAGAVGWDGRTEDDGVALDIFDAGSALLKLKFSTGKT
jgi:hypothetical protein